MSESLIAELLKRLTESNQLLFAALSDPLIPADQKGYIRSCYNLNKITLEGAKKEVTNDK